MKVRKRVIENPVYSDIIIRLGGKKRYVNDFVKYFIREDFLLDEKPYKKQPVLARQMEFLHEEGYLFIDEGHEKNKKYYSINFEKIIDDLIQYKLEILRQSYEKGEVLEKEYKKDVSQLEKKDFREKSMKNKLIQKMFGDFFDELHRNGCITETTIIKSIFDGIIANNYIDQKFSEHLLTSLDYFKVPKKAKQKDCHIDLKDYIDPNFVKDFDFFEKFLHIISIGTGMCYIFSDVVLMQVAGDLVNPNK